MKNLFVCLILLFALSCSKTVVPEQKIFENLPRCCKTQNATCEAAYKKGYTFENIEGVLYGGGANKDTILYNIIVADTLWKIEIPDEVLPWYKWCRPDIVPCNMPKEIIYSKRPRKVKFTCRVPYSQLPPPPQQPECLALVAELVRIELID